jgi:hypothetical protein
MRRVTRGAYALPEHLRHVGSKDIDLFTHKLSKLAPSNVVYERSGQNSYNSVRCS